MPSPDRDSFLGKMTLPETEWELRAGAEKEDGAW